MRKTPPSRPWKAARAPKREEFLSALEERQKDLEQEIADIHDLIKAAARRGCQPRRPSRRPTI